MEVFGNLAHGSLIDLVLRDLVYDLEHLNEKLGADGQLIHHFLLHANVVAFVLSEERTS